MLRAKNGWLALDGGGMDYIRFGSGNRVLVMIPGLSDGLKTVRGTALPFALQYRQLAQDFTVYAFSRRSPLPAPCSTREMAADLARAMEKQGIGPACVLGVSQGGMIAQYLAVDHPRLVERLVLAVTAAVANPTMRECIGVWLELAEKGDYRGLLLDTARRSYSPRYLERMGPALGLLGVVGRPKSFDRFRTQAEACLGHDALAVLGEIRCPTLVIGGEEDRIVTAAASRELHEAIPQSRLLLYPGLGHAAYEEARDFQRTVGDFFLKRESGV